MKCRSCAENKVDRKLDFCYGCRKFVCANCQARGGHTTCGPHYIMSNFDRQLLHPRKSRKQKARR